MDERVEVVVRRAAESDLDAVAHAWHESAVAMDGQPDVPSPEALRRRIDVELQSGWDLHVALRRQRVVGLIALRPGEASLDQIFVAPNEQRQGLGRILLAVAKQVMPGGFTLRMATANRGARLFYEAEGLKLLGKGIHPWSGVPVQYYGWKDDSSSKHLSR